MTRTIGCALSLLLFSLSGRALAVDGVVDINQARAIAGGVTQTDGPDFPVTIDQPGSYRLTGNLTLVAHHLTGVEITADNVTLDLNGFSIVGIVVCSGPTASTPVTSCSPSSFGGNGVYSLNSNVAVVNGSVRGMGFSGIRLLGASSSRVERVHVISNNGAGMQIGGAMGNAAIDNSADGNLLFGIEVGGRGATTRGNRATRNGGDGIRSGGVVSGNVATTNGGFGISVSSNGSAIGNVADFNTGLGFGVAGGAGLANNVANDNNGGNANPQTSFLFFQMGTNVCGGDTTCP